MMRSELKTIIIVVLLLISGTLAFNWIRDRYRFEQERKTYQLDNTKLQQKVLDIRDSSGREIQVYKIQSISIEQLRQGQVSDLTYQLKEANLKLKNVHNSTSVEQSTHDTLKIPIHDTIACLDSGVYEVAIGHSDSFLNLSGTATFRAIPGAITFEDTKLDYILHTGTTVTWVDKSQFLYKPQLELEITEHNPHTSTYGVKSYYINPIRHFYQKFWFHAIVGGIVTTIGLHYIGKLP